MRKALLIVLLMLCVLAFGVFLGRRSVAVPEAETVTRCDTIVVHDTSWYPEPVPVLIERVDTIPVLQVVIDSVTVEVLYERKVYEDSTYRAVVSGWSPKLEEIQTYSRTVTVTRETTVYEKAPEWDFRIAGGPGLFIGTDGRVRPGAGIIFGITRRF